MWGDCWAFASLKGSPSSLKSMLEFTDFHLYQSLILLIAYEISQSTPPSGYTEKQEAAPLWSQWKLRDQCCLHFIIIYLSAFGCWWWPSSTLDKQPANELNPPYHRSRGWSTLPLFLLPTECEHGPQFLPVYESLLKAKKPKVWICICFLYLRSSMKKCLSFSLAFCLFHSYFTNFYANN